MALTQNTYTGDGSTVLFSFTFPYIATTDIKVSVDGTATTAFSLANATTIQFNTAPASAAAIRIFRDTEINSLAAEFFSGSAIRASDLNDNFSQSLYVIQEVADRFVDNNAAAFNNNMDMTGNKIVNLAQGTASTDAVNVSQLAATETYNDTQLTAAVADATTQANNAAASYQSAVTAASGALGFKNQAEGSANLALSYMGFAQTAATNAGASAATAAQFAGKTIFFGYRRDANSNLELYYSNPSDTNTYAIKDYEYKGGSQWYIGSNDLLHTSGANVGQPKVAFNSNGHLIVTA